MNSLQIGSTLQNNKYKIIKILGQGGFGITYLAVHSLLDKKVAVKEFFPKDYCDRDENTGNIVFSATNTTELVAKLKTKFLKEAKNIAKLNHQNIVSIQDIFEENNTAYYLMDYVEGESLGDIIKRGGALDENTALRYIILISQAIDYMHSCSMNHLDIKPANIMIRKIDDMPILIDFGTSKQYDDDGEQTSTMIPGFTHGYAPIEQYKPGGVASFTPQTDIYALGATLYALLTGKKPPHYSDLLESGLPDFPEHVSMNTQKGIIHAMELKKQNRPQSVNAFLAYFNYSKKGNSSPQTEILDSRNQSFPSNDETIILEEIPLTDYNGHPYVDLGLSVKWASYNVDAVTELDSGRLFSFSMKNTNIPDNICGMLDYDVCRQKMGGTWRLPTRDEQTELRTKCRWEYDSESKRYKIIGPNGNYIYIPVTNNDTGRYWSGTLHITNKATAYYLLFDANTNNRCWMNEDINSMMAIRGVID